MVTTAEDLARAGIQIPILVGGAALSRNFTEKRILPAYGQGAVIYAQDAMNGLDLANRVVDPELSKLIFADLDIKRKTANEIAAAEPAKVPVEISEVRSASVRILASNPAPPDYKRHVQKHAPVEQIWKYINPLMLYTRHLGVKAKQARLFDQLAKDPAVVRQIKLEDPAAYNIWEKVEEVKAEFGHTETLRAAGVYRFFRASGEGNSLLIYDGENASAKPAMKFTFDRQSKGEKLCLSDYVSAVGGPADSVAFFVTTCGVGVREASAVLREKGEFLKSHILQAVAIETAEAYAEYMHAFLRSSWGYPDEPSTTMMERFQAKYRGKRYSFGYPACPRLEDQVGLFELLHPRDIGVELTEGYMMDPESTVSALVFHHPDAKYYGVNGDLTT